MNTKQYFSSDNLSFVAAALLAYPGRVSIKKVEFHPSKQGVKLYFLSPFEDVKQIYLEYVSDSLKLSPAQLSEKIAALKFIQADRPTVEVKESKNNNN